MGHKMVHNDMGVNRVLAPRMSYRWVTRGCDKNKYDVGLCAYSKLFFMGQPRIIIK